MFKLFLPTRLYSTSLRKIPRTTRIITSSQELRRVNRTKLISLEQEFQPCTTLTSCEKYDLNSIKKLDNFKVNELIPNSILHFKYKNDVDVLVLETGSVVGWGIEEDEIKDSILPSLKSSMITPYKYPESEDMDFFEINSSDEESHIVGEVFVINTFDKDQALLDKAAFSSGLSRSARLAVLENALERRINQTRKITESLSKGESIKITEEELLKSIGELFLLRGKLNLYSELIEIPDLYWSEPTLEKIYKITSNILDISPRIAILNKKLDYCTDESRALLSSLSEKKGTRLEWIIIILIMIEVCFEIFHFYEKYEERLERKKQSNN